MLAASRRPTEKRLRGTSQGGCCRSRAAGGPSQALSLVGAATNNKGLAGQIHPWLRLSKLAAFGTSQWFLSAWFEMHLPEPSLVVVT